MTEKSNKNFVKGKDAVTGINRNNKIKSPSTGAFSPSMSPRVPPTRSPKIRPVFVNANMNSNMPYSPGGNNMMMVNSPLLQSTHSPLGMVAATPDGTGRTCLPNLPNLAATSVSVSRSRCNSISSSYSNVSISDPSVEAAIDAERARIREREREENDVKDATVLKAALKRERAHSVRLAADLARFKSSSVRSQAEAEAHEEGIINGLLRRLDTLQQEKGRIIVELEREEEMLANTLQKKLNNVRKEKILLQAQIDKEHRHNTQLKEKLQDEQQVC